METNMKRKLLIAIVLLAGTVPALHAARNRDISNQFVQGTVLKVQRDRVESPDVTIGGSNPSDVPLTSRFYRYEIAIRVVCETYIGRYDSPFNALVLPITPDRPVRVRVGKRVMTFDFPDNPDVRMTIVRRTNNCGAMCGHNP
jgi:hypothetical protein